MFSYDCADIKYAVTWGKLDGSSDIEYLYDLNKKEARIYTKARMLGEDLDEVMDTYRIEREIIRYEKSEYDSDISYARVSIWFCDNQEQPPIEDVKEYLKDLLALHRVTFAREVVEAQINVFEDTENDWNKIALDLAMEVNCPGYAKKYQEGKFNKEIWNKEREKLLKILSKQKPKKRDKKESLETTYTINPWVDKPPKPEPEGEEKVRRHRGCKDITKPDDKQLHIITESGKEVVIDAVPPFRLNFYGDGLCPFTTECFWSYRERGCIDGKWGFFNTKGEIVIEPQYLYVCGPYGSYDDEYYLVCKTGCGINWGVLDSKGNESLPCEYKELIQTSYGSKYHDVLIYHDGRHYDSYGLFLGNKLFGLMKRDGTVILEPQFCYISPVNFNWDNKLFLAGRNNNQFGVFSLGKNKFLTPQNCDNVKFNDETKIFVCHYPLEGQAFTLGSRYEATFDYDGNLISKIKQVYNYSKRCFEVVEN